MGVPCYSLHGLDNLSAMMLMMLDGFDADGIRQRLTRYYEIRGYEGGIYVGVEELPELANEMGIKYHPREVPIRADSSLLDCTFEEFFLLTTNESATLYAVERRRGLVHD